MRTKVRGFVIRVCDDCLNLRGESCNNPECAFIRMRMSEVAKLLDALLIRPVIDGVMTKVPPENDEYLGIPSREAVDDILEDIKMRKDWDVFKGVDKPIKEEIIESWSRIIKSKMSFIINGPDLGSPITIAELAGHILGRPAVDKVDYKKVKLPIFGECMGCHASIAAFNSYPSKNGFIMCKKCIGDQGWENLEDARKGLFEKENSGNGN